MIHFSIRVRLAAWYLAILSTGLILLGAVVWICLRQTMLASVDADLASRTANFVRFVEQESHGSDLAALRDESREYSTTLPTGHSLRVWTADGSLLYAAPSSESMQQGNHRFNREDVSVLGHRVSIELGASLEEVSETLSLLRTILFSSVPLILIIATAGGWWISGRALQPVDTLTTAAEAIGPNDLSSRLPVPGTRDELQRLAEAWNRMLGRIAASVEQMKRFTADAAHELRTPVTIVMSTAEVALRRERDADAYRTALSGIHAESVRLATLVEELLWLARADGGTSGLNSEDVVIEDLVSDVFATARSLAAHRGVSLVRHSDGQTNTAIRCDRRAMRQCLMVLLDNAIKFTPSGGVIRLRVTQGPERCRIEVHDSGRGIEEQHLPYIFDRFYQADKSRATSGFGLGLSIAKGIVEAHQGLIAVTSSRENGSCFYLELPLERRPEPSPTGTIWAPVQ